MASLRAEGIDTLVPALVRVARVTSPTLQTATLTCAAAAAGAAR